MKRDFYSDEMIQDDRRLLFDIYAYDRRTRIYTRHEERDMYHIYCELRETKYLGDLLTNLFSFAVTNT